MEFKQNDKFKPSSSVLTEFKCGAVNQNTWEYTRTARACLVWQKLREFLVKTSNQDGPLNFPMKNLSRSYLTASFQTTSTSKTRFIVNTNHAPNLISQRSYPENPKKKKKKKRGQNPSRWIVIPRQNHQQFPSLWPRKCGFHSIPRQISIGHQFLIHFLVRN